MKPFIAAVTCMAVVAACAGGKRGSMVAAPQSADPAAGASSPAQIGNDPRGEIEALYAQVEKKRETMGLAEPQIATPLAPSGANPMATAPSSDDQTCKPAKNDKCSQSCELSDSICDNAKRICDLASEMKSEWAYDKCAKAKSTCETSHETCCTCQ